MKEWCETCQKIVDPIFTETGRSICPTCKERTMELCPRCHNHPIEIDDFGVVLCNLCYQNDKKAQDVVDKGIDKENSMFGYDE